MVHGTAGLCPRRRRCCRVLRIDAVGSSNHHQRPRRTPNAAAHFVVRAAQLCCTRFRSSPASPACRSAAVSPVRALETMRNISQILNAACSAGTGCWSVGVGLWMSRRSGLASPGCCPERRARSRTRGLALHVANLVRWQHRRVVYAVEVEDPELLVVGGRQDREANGLVHRWPRPPSSRHAAGCGDAPHRRLSAEPDSRCARASRACRAAPPAAALADRIGWTASKSGRAPPAPPSAACPRWRPARASQTRARPSTRRRAARRRRARTQQGQTHKRAARTARRRADASGARSERGRVQSYQRQQPIYAVHVPRGRQDGRVREQPRRR